MFTRVMIVALLISRHMPAMLDALPPAPLYAAAMFRHATLRVPRARACRSAPRHLDMPRRRHA